MNRNLKSFKDYKKWRKLIVYFVSICIFQQLGNLYGQDYFFISGNFFAYNVEFNNGLCGCSIQNIGPTNGFSGGITYSPENILYFLGGTPMDDNVIFSIDPTTGGIINIIMSGPSYLPIMNSFVSIGNGMFYSQPYPGVGNDSIYKWDVNSNTVIAIGATGLNSQGDMTMSGGEIYFPILNSVTGMRSIIHLDESNPSNSQIVLSYPESQAIAGLTSSPYCNILIGVDVYAHNFVSINLIDGSIEPICSFAPIVGLWLTSPNEYSTLDCSIYLDLDCDDSSGATDADYNSPQYDCLSQGVSIADEDIKMLYDAIVTSMTIKVVGNVPDAPDEILDMTGSVAGINVTGVGTDMITLTNAGGAKSTDFKDALRLIVYKDLASPLTTGPRTVEVQFTTASGAMSNIATAFIDVTSLPLVDVDLGPDQYICEGQSTIFDAGIPGAIYTWSTGVHTQTITAFESGQYIVTVADGLHCPGKDTVELNVVPIIQVALEGDDEICDNQSAELIIQTNTPFSLSVDISSNPGSPFHFTGINEDFTFNDFPTQTTIYTITNVSASDSACFELTDPIQIVDVYPTYTTTKDATICEGDSIWLGFYWETEPGVHENTLNTIHHCDSTVITTLTVLPAIQMSAQGTTCDSASAGVFVTFLNNPNGCDTMVTTTVTLLPSDTSLINLLSCNISSVGTSTQTLTNQHGCDSLIITTTSWTPPSDTTLLSQTTCDSSLLGVFPQLLIAQDGCDSIVITTVTMAPSDTTYLSGVSCDSASIGVFQKLLSNQMGCDSLVVTTITAGTTDTTLIFSTSCDSSSLGIFETHFTTSNQCDSVVITTVTYSAQDSTFITASSCNPA